MSKYEFVIYDVDGTLIDPIQGVKHALDIMADQLGWRRITVQEMEGVIGPPMKKTLMRIYGLSETDATKFVSLFRKIYTEETLFECVMYPGVLEMMRKIHESGYKIGIATYKQTECATAIVRHYGMTEYVDVVSGDSKNSTLTKADIIKRCIEELGVDDLKKVLMVGDTIADYEGSQIVGVDFCGVTYGYGFDNDCKDNKDIRLIQYPLELLELEEMK